VSHGRGHATAQAQANTGRVSRSGQMLEQVMERGGAAAAAVMATGIHITQLWRYRTGRGRPGASNTAKLHRATNGKIAAEGWADFP
jgi:hypothetical protein